MKGFLFAIFILITTCTNAQIDYYNKDFLRYDDYTYVDHIATVQLLKMNADFELPAIQLGSTDKLLLTFDDLNSKTLGYYYKIILCNSNWTPTELMPMEYITGLTEIYFNETKFSFNTTKSYSHYETIIPSPQFEITRSGNYLLYIYAEGAPEKPIITQRFYVYENQVDIQASVSIASNPQERLSSQEIKLVVDKMNYEMPEIYDNLTVAIQQNGRKDNIQFYTTPKSVLDHKIIYSDLNEIVFEAGNEFRKLDIRSLLIQSATIDKIWFDTLGYRVKMLPDKFRANSNYINYQDINGSFKIINWDDPHFSSAIESDYAIVNLILLANRYATDGEFYVIGEFSNWRFDPKFKLKYNSMGYYEIALFLKQAYYDYAYVFLPNKEKIAETNLTEGNHSDTENQYHIFVYYRDAGELNDKLIGLKTISSK